ncbi:chemotaxis protein CheX [Pseudalkalibacillus berkeleyi]|uniref:Chemotaxis protein CheX n=1 Tax=Pseudalkalibacillus berkeleyi TaxID=1069813 RepID=A0ABS9H4F6_9BACL|nr:chemotaxis protein CheX [Pseudalkalibacillus berkeleyi]MCF6138976.1 chemotaxis protein CheX [Pseudalkalibacillus berkeleyi]
MTNLLNGTINVVKTVLPMDCEVGKPQSSYDSVNLNQAGVAIGLEKEINGTLLFLGSRELFGECGNKMFGMPFEGEMLDSFMGELGNILAGNIATHLSTENITIDITTPRVVDTVSFTADEKVISVPMKLDGFELMILIITE